MNLPIYHDFVEKYTPEKPFERDPYGAGSWMTNDSYYAIHKKSRFIDIHEMLNSLYEDKLVSYVRTNTRLMSVEQFEDRFSIFDSIANVCFKDRATMQLLMKMDVNLMKTDCWVENLNAPHYALTPVACPNDIIMDMYFNTSRRSYEAVRKNIYLDICKAYIHLFIPD
jgi:DNA topoisomerase IA